MGNSVQRAEKHYQFVKSKLEEYKTRKEPVPGGELYELLTMQFFNVVRLGGRFSFVGLVREATGLREEVFKPATLIGQEHPVAKASEEFKACMLENFGMCSNNNPEKPNFIATLNPPLSTGENKIEISLYLHEDLEISLCDSQINIVPKISLLKVK